MVVVVEVEDVVECREEDGRQGGGPSHQSDIYIGGEYPIQFSIQRQQKLLLLATSGRGYSTNLDYHVDV